MSATENDLATIAAEGGLEALEVAWLERLEDPPPAAHFLSALRAVRSPQRQSDGATLLLLLLDSYQGRGAYQEALVVLRALRSYRVDTARVDLGATARKVLAELYASEDWWDLFGRISGLNKDKGDATDALERFDRLLALLPGAAVLHSRGWGDGLVRRLDVPEEGFHVLFRREPGRERFMPFTTGLEVLTVLPADDLRARILQDLEGLRRQAQESPSQVIRAVCRVAGGRATSQEVKTWLVGDVIEESAWGSWWRKAKAAAGADAWLALENPSRPVFVLRQRAVTQQDQIQQAMGRAATLPALLEVVRGPLGLDPEPEVKAAMLGRLEEVLAAVCPGAPESLGSSRLALAESLAVAAVEAALLLARHARWTREAAGSVLCSLGRAGRPFGALASALPQLALRREAFDALLAAEPKMWSDELIGQLASLPSGLLDAVAERLLAEGRGEALANRFGIFLLTPSRQPETVLRLARRHAAGMFAGIAGAPTAADVVMGLLHLVETQAPRALRDKEARAPLEGAIDALLGERDGLLAGFAAAATRAQMEATMHVRLRCRAMPERLAQALDKACHERFPDLVPRDETPFWESGHIYSTRDGIARQQERYRVLVQEKIPENSATIGRAAAYGDLSENFEWASAIEQQRQLTEKAASMEAELKLGHAIEDQEQPEGVVAPGTRVRFEQPDGSSNTITILGPWDEGEDVVSYRAPMAAGMLGAKAGQTVTLELPAGAVQVTVRAIERVI